ncbi:hypothetical protein K501DRAFT_255484 [Backusella circina FSU 941]|nr:hypothetical protein K501DRAFT_255484 [Backusella circina FSU 941]
MSHFLYPGHLLVRLPHLDQLFERQPTNEVLSQIVNGSNSNNITATASADIHNHKYSSNNSPDTSSEHKCWICWDTIDTSKQQWIRPCKCSLVSHQHCLLSWITENQKFSPRKKVYCPQCSSLYVLSQGDSLPLTVMNLTYSALHRITPYLTFLGLGCSILITSTSFGIFTVFTLFGKEEGEIIIGDSKNWSWKTWLGLPTIPAILVGSRFPNLDTCFPFISTLVLRLSSNSQKATWPPSPAILFGALSCAR